jgi:hypothetical protein
VSPSSDPRMQRNVPHVKRAHGALTKSVQDQWIAYAPKENPRVDRPINPGVLSLNAWTAGSGSPEINDLGALLFRLGQSWGGSVARGTRGRGVDLVLKSVRSPGCVMPRDGLSSEAKTFPVRASMTHAYAGYIY